MVAQPVAVAPAPISVPEAPLPSAPMPQISVQQYLEMERTSKVRHEYVDGEVIEMAGETPAHNRIAGNIYRQLGNRFEDLPCEAFFENIRVRVTPTQYRYPDVVALCGEAQFDDTRPPALLNPVVIFEVLSPSTENEDREEKWTEYQQLASVTDYVLVAQDKAQVIHYTRESEARWTITIHRSLQDTLALTAVNTSLSLADIYRKIVFAPSELPEAAE